MAKQVSKKFVWVIKNFSSLQSEKPIYSVTVLIGDCKWRLCAYPKGKMDVNNFSLYLQVVDYDSLPSGWRRYVKFRLAIVSEDPKIYTVQKGNIVVNGFQVLPSQVESVKHIFERHPDIAVDLRAKSQQLSTTCMNFLLSLIQTLCKSLEELSNEDFVDADIALTCLKDVGFKVDWLEKKLDHVKEKKEKEQSSLAQLQETEENILKLKQKLSELDALAEEQKAELSAIRTTLSFNDVI